jgi:hypothetical protein
MGLNLYVLSENSPDNRHVGWAVSQNLEEVLCSVFDPVFFYPTQNQSIRLGSLKFPDRFVSFARRHRHRLFCSWYDLEHLPSLGSGINVLLVVGLESKFLLSMHALGSLLERFDVRIGYLLDGFNANHLNPAAISYLDYLFTISQDMADSVRNIHGIDAMYLPLAANTLGVELNRQHRWIDVLSYGRRNEAIHRQLNQRFGRAESDRFYLYSTFSKPDLLDRGEHMMLHSRLLNHAKISLCFEASDVPRFYQDSPLLYRWLEGWLYGCTIVGKRPFGTGVAELMDWENSAIDFPRDGNAVEFLESLLADQDFLAHNSLRNHCECLMRHDWRYRLRDMLAIASLPVPARLEAEIQALQEKGDRLLEECRIPIYM